MRLVSNTGRFSFSKKATVIFFMLLSGNLIAQTDSIVFNFKRDLQTWIVPKGVTQIHIDAYGAQGGSEQGGKGGRVESDLKVTPGSTLYIKVGSQPSGNEGGSNGGGKGCGSGTGGGGASDIRIGGTELTTRVLVAGGGGGMSYNYNGIAGLGGGLTGGDGTFDTLSYHTAKGGTQDAGGEGAAVYFAPSGKAGKGGDGLNSRGKCVNDGMGGGGGGYFGGGAGGAGGGGGGSSYANKNNTNVVHTQGVNVGDGKIIIYWHR